MIFITGLTLTSGCTSVPNLDVDNVKVISQLSNIVECESLNIFRNLDKKAVISRDRWLLTYTITSKAEETANVGADPLGWIVPAHIDKLVLNGRASIKRDATRTGSVEYNLRLNKKDSTACDEKAKSRITVAPADFKLREWTNQLLASSARPDTFSYTIDVVVTKSASFGADIADGHFSGSPGVDGTRQTTQTVEFNFAEIPDKVPADVYVTNFPKRPYLLVSPVGKDGKHSLEDFNKVLPEGQLIMPSSPARKVQPQLDIERAKDLNRLQRTQNRLDSLTKGLE
ncbi:MULTISPECIES: hypothetical protein [unclassified Rhizobium]|uniref:hypothetical protein n=1 Tax=unclassified Rhizobium TaxID=2613769 RepID=UPI0037F497DF